MAARDSRYEDEGWLCRKDGSRLFANVVMTAVRDEGGEILGFANATRAPDVEGHTFTNQRMKRLVELRRFHWNILRKDGAGKLPGQ